jgi:Spy/CpxP family protein refolding chaperone
MRSAHNLWVLAGACLLLVAGSSAQGQPGHRGGPGGPGRPEFRAFDRLQDLLRSEDVQKELEVTQEQLAEIEKIDESRRELLIKIWEDFGRAMSPEDRRQKFLENREKVNQFDEQADAKIADILRPAQLKRLKQIQFQASLRRGVSNALTRGPLGEALDVTEDQKQKLQEVRAEVDRELREKIEQLRREAQDKILGVLSPEQRDRFKELTGEPFQVRRGGGRPFGRGGEGGQKDNRRPPPPDRE